MINRRMLARKEVLAKVSKHASPEENAQCREGREKAHSAVPPTSLGTTRDDSAMWPPPIPAQTANVAYAPSMPLAGDGDDIVTSAPYTPTREGKT